MTFFLFWLLSLPLIILSYVSASQAAGVLRNVTLDDNALTSIFRFSLGWRRVTDVNAIGGSYASSHRVGSWVEAELPEGVTAVHFMGFPGTRSSRYLVCLDCSTEGAYMDVVEVEAADSYSGRSKSLFTISGTNPSVPHSLHVVNWWDATHGGHGQIALDGLVVTIRVQEPVFRTSGHVLSPFFSTNENPWIVGDSELGEESEEQLDGSLRLYSGMVAPQRSGSPLQGTPFFPVGFIPEGSGEPVSNTGPKTIASQAVPPFTTDITSWPSFQFVRPQASNFNSPLLAQSNVMVDLPSSTIQAVTPPSQSPDSDTSFTTFKFTLGPFTIVIPVPVSTTVPQTSVSTSVPVTSGSQTSTFSGSQSLSQPVSSGSSTIEPGSTASFPATTTMSTGSSVTVPSGISPTFPEVPSTSSIPSTTTSPTISNLPSSDISSASASSSILSVSSETPSTSPAPSSSVLTSTLISSSGLTTSPFSLTITISATSSDSASPTSALSSVTQSSDTLHATLTPTTSTSGSTKSLRDSSTSASETTSSVSGGLTSQTSAAGGTLSSTQSGPISASQSSTSRSSSGSASISTTATESRGSSSSVTVSSGITSRVLTSSTPASTLSISTTSSSSAPGTRSNISTGTSSSSGITSSSATSTSATDASTTAGSLGNSQALSTSLVVLVAVLASLSIFSILLAVIMIVRHSRRRSRTFNIEGGAASIITPFPPGPPHSGLSPPSAPSPPSAYSSSSKPTGRNSYTTKYFGDSIIPRPYEAHLATSGDFAGLSMTSRPDHGFASVIPPPPPPLSPMSGPPRPLRSPLRESQYPFTPSAWIARSPKTP
ncbi:unnamed protein product [Somion occarium]|uniref:Transmembrane protein n=2 Tax=Somion occarium TaxID=3059160 RepID=A0ABP1CPX7_9APHY